MSCLNNKLKQPIFLLLSLGLIACDIQDDLLPDSHDARANITPGSIGSMPTQIAADFTIKDSLNNNFILSEHLTDGSTPADVIVLYFTMWCPICLSHSDHILNSIMPQYSGRGTVIYGLVDYVSGSVAATRATELASGYGRSNFTILADVNQDLAGQFNAAMATVVVIDSSGSILLNEDFRNGAALVEILEQHLP